VNRLEALRKPFLDMTREEQEAMIRGVRAERAGIGPAIMDRKRKRKTPKAKKVELDLENADD
jgi:hypothetical protein